MSTVIFSQTRDGLVIEKTGSASTIIVAVWPVMVGDEQLASTTFVNS